MPLVLFQHITLHFSKPSTLLLFLHVSCQMAIIPPSVTLFASWCTDASFAIWSALSFPLIPVWAYIQASMIMCSVPLYCCCFQNIPLMVSFRAAVLAQPLFPAFTIALIAACESKRFRMGPVAQCRMASCIPSISPSHTVALVLMAVCCPCNGGPYLVLSSNHNKDGRYFHSNV